VRPVLPLPIAVPASEVQPDCVKTWTAGLIVSDKPDILSEEWRKAWLTPITDRGTFKGQSYTSIEPLKAYFRDGPKTTGAEALVLLAHHGAGDIAAREDAPETDRILPDHVRKRLLAPGSFGIFAACSVGALGEKQSTNTLLLHVLNEHNMQAAIASPFKVPPKVAKRFLYHFRDSLFDSKCPLSLYGLFECAKGKLLKSKDQEDDTRGMKSGAELFMLIGNGDLRVCKP